MKSSLVSIAISVASPGRCSRMGRQKVPTPGPYSTNNFVVFQSTGRSMWRIRVGDDGTIDPTMTGCLMKPRTNMPHGPKKRLSFARIRSEEHTSELQSLMRISYAVFCLKKKKKKQHKHTNST